MFDHYEDSLDERYDVISCFKLEITENCCKNQRTSEIIILITGSKNILFHC